MIVKHRFLVYQVSVLRHQFEFLIVTLAQALDLMDSIETQQIPERELWMLWFAMVQEEVGLSE